MNIYLDKELVYKIDDKSLKILLHDIHERDLSHHIKHLVKHIIESKVNNCKKRMLREWAHRLKSKNIDIPSDENEFIDYILDHPDYKKRSQRQNPLSSNIKDFVL